MYYYPISLLSIVCACDYDRISRLVGQLFDGHTLSITWYSPSANRFILERDIHGNYSLTLDEKTIQIWQNENKESFVGEYTFYEQELHLVLENSSTSARGSLFETISSIFRSEEWKIYWRGSRQQEFLLQKQHSTVKMIQWIGKHDTKIHYFSSKGSRM